MTTFSNRDSNALPQLLIFIDAEEEFEWTSFSLNAVGVSNVAECWRLQVIFDKFGIIPTYLVTYPVATQAHGRDPIIDILTSGKCFIGAQLHPWVTPPFEEEFCNKNSYPGNLPAALERAKLLRLTETIADAFDVRPTIYRAGRYGFGPNTQQTLCALEYEIDTSVVPHTDFRAQAGPDFSGCPDQPYWLSSSPPLFEIPVTTGIVGILPKSLRHIVQPYLNAPSSQRLRLRALSARLRLSDHIRLSPEGATIEEAIRLTRALLRSGHRVFTVTLHSSSLVPGNNPFVRTARDLARLYDWFEQYLPFFFDEIGGTAATPQQIRQDALQTLPRNEQT